MADEAKVDKVVQIEVPLSAAKELLAGAMRAVRASLEEDLMAIDSEELRAAASNLVEAAWKEVFRG